MIENETKIKIALLEKAAIGEALIRPVPSIDCIYSIPIEGIVKTHRYLKALFSLENDLGMVWMAQLLNDSMEEERKAYETVIARLRELIKFKDGCISELEDKVYQDGENTDG
jgi:hypothetical protein